MFKKELMKQKIESLLKKGEGIAIEFKKSSQGLSQSAFDSVCAFLNRAGSELILGVDDDANVLGIRKDLAQQMISQFVNNMNNVQKINPPFYLNPELVEYEGHTLIYVYVPQSSQVHKHKNKIFDRNEDGDFDITDQQASIAQLCLRKQTFFYENTVYPYLALSDFREDLFAKVRQILQNARPDHI